MEEKKKEEAQFKIQLSAKEFIKAMKKGRAIDKNGVEHIFALGEDQNGIQSNWIENVKVTEEIIVFGGLFEHPILLIKNCELLSLRISNSTLIKLDLHGLHIDNYLYILGIKGETFRIANSIINGPVSINHTTLSFIECLNSNFLDSLDITANSLNETLAISKISVQKITSLHSNKFQSILVAGSSFESIIFPSIPEKSKMVFTKSKFDKAIVAENYTNLGYMQWSDLETNGGTIILIKNAVLGKFDIINCDLYSCKMFIIGSKITDAFYTNTRLPDVLSIPEKLPNPNDILRDGYNQLKTIAQKQNDRKMFLHY